MKNNMENKNKFPHLSREELRKMAEELSDPNLEPSSHSHDWESEFKYKMNEVAKELAERIEKEKQTAYQAGLAEGKKTTQVL